MLVIPTFNVCYSMFSILGGGIFFGEFDGFDATAWSVFPLSMCITFSGIYLITTGRDATKTSSSDARHGGGAVDDKDTDLPTGFSELELSEIHDSSHHGSNRLLMPRRKSVSMSVSDEDDVEESKADDTASITESLSVPVKSIRSAPSSTHSSSSSYNESPRHLSPPASQLIQVQRFQQHVTDDSSIQGSRSLSPTSFTKHHMSGGSRLTGNIKAHSVFSHQTFSSDDLSISDSEEITARDNQVHAGSGSGSDTPSVVPAPSRSDSDRHLVDISSEAPSIQSNEGSPMSGLSGFVTRHLSTRYSTLSEGA